MCRKDCKRVKELQALSEDKVVLVTMKPTPNMPTFAPPAIKVEAFMRFHKIPYITECICEPKNSPTGQLPYIYHKGTAIAESHQIIDYLTHEFDCKPDGHLTIEQTAVANSMIRMLEDHYAEYCMMMAFNDPPSFENVKKLLFSTFKLPKFFWGIMGWVMRKHMEKEWKHKGPGRYPQSLISSEAHKDFNTFADYLGDKKFMMGDRLSTVDMVALSVFGLDFFEGLGIEMRSHMMERENFGPYMHRVRDAIFPEYKREADRKDGQAIDMTEEALPAYEEHEESKLLQV